MPLPFRTASSLLALALVCGPLRADPEDVPARRLPPPMTFTPEQLRAHEARRQAQRPAFIDPARYHQIARGVAAGASNVVNLLPYLAYDPSKWYQGGCGDCWIWGSTAAASILLAADGSRDLLSVQYMNSGYNGGRGMWACCGGDTATFAAWYAGQGRFISERNDGAAFADASSNCEGETAQPFKSIARDPSHPIKGIRAERVEVSGLAQDQAILNLKTLLSQNRPVLFSFFLPEAGWRDFESFWSGSSEDTPWAGVDRYDGTTFDSGAGGHLVCIVGYDDRDRTWIVLNSWGTTRQRPHGTYKLPQAMGYSNTMTYEGQPLNQFQFDQYVVDRPESPRQVTASIMAPAPGTTVTSGQAVTFRGTGTDSEVRAPLTYSWSFGDGATATGATATHTYTNAGARALSQEVTLTVADDTGAKGTTALTLHVDPAPPSSGQLLVNPGFEEGNRGWAASEGVLGAFGSHMPAHGGSRVAWLCGYPASHRDTLAQTVALPAAASRATLSFWSHIETARRKGKEADTLTVRLRNAFGKELAVLARLTAADAASGWRQRSFDLTAWKGQKVELLLEGKQASDQQTSFVLDDFALDLQP